MTEQIPLELETRNTELETEKLETRNWYLERLREKLNDPEFRAIEGFPIGEDEDILALSDPPYYTACPNPFLPEIIERWQAERAELRRELGLPDDSADDGNGGEPVYHREPFATDVSEGKSGPVYRAHSYHTKVPYKAVMHYILHYTDPGDVIFDGFCGTGMTGVAAQLCNDKKTVESLGYRVKSDGTILDEQGQAISRLGARKAVLVDLSPAATFIAYNYNTPADVSAFEREAKRILEEVEKECGWMYLTLHQPKPDQIEGALLLLEATAPALMAKESRLPCGRINYTVWSDVFVCPECAGEIIFWDEAVDKSTWQVKKRFSCPHCKVAVSKTDLERVFETRLDRELGEPIRQARQVPVLIHYVVGKGRYLKTPDAFDLALLHKIDEKDIPWRVPTDQLPDGYNTRQPVDSHNITHVHHFYTQRNLWSLAAYAGRLRLPRKFVNVTSTAMVVTKMYRFRSQNRSLGAGGGPLTGTLYIPSLSKEIPTLKTLREHISKTTKLRSLLQERESNLIGTGSHTQVHGMPNGSVDYIFTDPPFGGNLMYSELNYLWESWLRVFTNNELEAIVNNVQRKALLDYQDLMVQCFRESYRILKPGRWMTVEFHNSQNAIWNAIQEAILRAGFMIADVRTLDKKQGSFKQVTTSAAVKQDLIISAYKPRSGFERRFLEQAGTEEGAWAFVRQHLDKLPIVVERDGALEVVAERQAYLLYDRMVAFHIQRGFSVPLGAAEFYGGLKQRFPERDGMYFLSHQVAEYDRRRMQVSQVEQLALFVTDEKSAIQWLRRELDPATGSGPQTYQDLQPKFLRELHQARHEALPELSDVLAQNFLKDEQDRWYVPDPGHQEDLEKLRERSLLREFQEYAGGKGRLKVFRTEAVRAGFKHAWHERDYRLIVKVAERLRPSVLQEDAGLLMYYDNALMRAESESEQGRLL